MRNLALGDIEGQREFEQLLIQAATKMLPASKHFYNGSWVRGARHGYGVMEAGEKYLGMWEENVRQGPGCVVNIDRIYYQGKILIIKISSNRLRIFDSGAKFWREFGFAKFSGKGILYF